MKYALVEPNGRIAQVVTRGNTFPTHIELKWVECPDECTDKWTYENREFKPKVRVIVDNTLVPLKQKELEELLIEKGVLSNEDVLNKKRRRND